MTSSQISSEPGLPFEEERAVFQARARRTYWRLIIWCSIILVVSTIPVAIIAQFFTQLSDARSRHSAPPFPSLDISIPTIGGDPSLTAYERTLSSCSESQNHGEIIGDESTDKANETLKCSFRRLLAHGEDRKAIAVLDEIAKTSDESWPYAAELLRSLLPDGLSEASLRGDWATCKRYSRLTLSVLDRADTDPLNWNSTTNKALLLAVLCDEPIAALQHYEISLKIAAAINSGTHLSEEFIQSLQIRTDQGFSDRWFRLLTGIHLLRAEQFSEASRQLRTLDTQEPTTFNDLVRLQLARTVYWNFERRSPSLGLLAIKQRNEAIVNLRSLEAKMREGSLKTDVAAYRERLSIDSSR